MKTQLSLLLILFACLNTFSQGWTEPITIYSGGHNSRHNFTLDNNGVLHCVWTHKIEDDHRKIYYSKSTDNGDTWSEAYDLSQNESEWYTNPQIISDTLNHLFVSYDTNSGNPYLTYVVIKKFDGQQWNIADTVSTSMPGSRHSRLAVDRNNKLYCFWFHDTQGGKSFYRIFEEGEWSDIHQPFSGNLDKYFISKVIFDNVNKLHCIGTHRYEGLSIYNTRLAYYSYFEGIWSEVTILNDNRILSYDLSIDYHNHLYLSYTQYLNNYPPIIIGSFFRKFDGITWNNPIQLSVNNPEDITITVDTTNNPHIVYTEKDNNSFNQIHNKVLGYEQNIIDDGYLNYYSNKLQSEDSYLYLIYGCNNVNKDKASDCDILLTKFDIYTGSNIHKKKHSGKIFPNPTKQGVHINYSNGAETPLSVMILNTNSQIIRKIRTTGSQDIQWDGMDDSGNNVPDGIYFIVLKTNKGMYTEKLIKIN